MNFPSLCRAIFGIILTAVGAATITAVTVEGTKKAINNARLQDCYKQFDKTMSEWRENKLQEDEYNKIISKLQKDIDLLKQGIDPDEAEES